MARRSADRRLMRHAPWHQDLRRDLVDKIAVLVHSLAARDRKAALGSRLEVDLGDECLPEANRIARKHRLWPLEVLEAGRRPPDCDRLTPGLDFGLAPLPVAHVEAGVECSRMPARGA